MIPTQADSEAPAIIAPQARKERGSWEARRPAGAAKAGRVADEGPTDTEFAMVVISQPPEASMLAPDLPQTIAQALSACAVGDLALERSRAAMWRVRV